MSEWIEPASTLAEVMNRTTATAPAFDPHKIS